MAVLEGRARKKSPLHPIPLPHLPIVECASKREQEPRCALETPLRLAKEWRQGNDPLPPWMFQTGMTFADLLKPLMSLPGAR
jgi:hypothetical protein